MGILIKDNSNHLVEDDGFISDDKEMCQVDDKKVYGHRKETCPTLQSAIPQDQRKDDDGQPEHQDDELSKAKTNKVRDAQKKESTSSKSIKATEKSKHTVVRGSQGGKNIVQEIVNNVPTFYALENSSLLEARDGLEHHQDSSGSHLVKHKEVYISEEDEIKEDSMDVAISI
ncbi:hypothetical protein PTKIN_Ptkin11bG0151500 [Pterospermum kingtungense]